MKETSGESKLVDQAYVDRRSFLSAALSTCAVTSFAPLSLQFAPSLAKGCCKTLIFKFCRLSQQFRGVASAGCCIELGALAWQLGKFRSAPVV